MNPHDLPVYQQRERIIKELERNDVIVVESPTGSGKTTQMPLILHEFGYSSRGVIGVTQPRRIAAISVCEYMAKQLEVPVGTTAGYKIRFADKTGSDTLLKIMTDGILLQELKADRLLSKYSVIMVDEAHERSLNIDFILGLLKQIREQRSDFKIIISSATINSQTFSEYFDNCPIIHIDAHIYPIDTRYRPLPLADNEEVLIDTITKIVWKRVNEDPEGDMLIFLPGEKLITNCAISLGNQDTSRKLHILPLFGRLPKEEQERIFEPTPAGKRKIVVSTNIAETSVTIDNITTVIDSGLAKLNYYNPRTFTSSLIEESISKASCNQRKGRAGRTGPGVCCRLYEKDNYARRIMYTPEEIKRTDLSEVILRMAELGITDFTHFDFLTHPGDEGIESAIDTLRMLDALDKDNRLTTTGEIMVRFPLLPRFSRIITEAIIKYHDILEEAIIAASFLSARSPYILPLGEEMEARAAHQAFSSDDGDFLSYVKLFRQYQGLSGDKKRTGFCSAHYLEKQTMNELLNIFEQLSEIVSEMGIPLSSGGSVHDYLCAVSAGLVQFVCIKRGRNIYKSLTADKIHIHPGSSMFRQAPMLIVAGEIVRTSRMFARSVSPLKKNWLSEIHRDLAQKLQPRDQAGVREGERKSRLEQEERRSAPKETVRICRKEYPVTRFQGKKKMAVLPLEDLLAHYSCFQQELRRHRQLRIAVEYRSFNFHVGDRLKSILKAVPFFKPDSGIIDAPPAGTFHPEENPDELFGSLHLLLCFCKLRKEKRTLGFVTLDNDGEGGFRFKSIKNFHTAADTSLYSIEMLADLDAVKEDSRRKKELNSIYRELTTIFET